MPQSFYDAQPPLAQTALPVHPEFPANTTGLAWFSCQAEGAQYPIDYRHNYPTLVQQELRRAYYSAVSFTDDNIGNLLAHMDALGITNDTLVVFHAGTLCSSLLANTLSQRAPSTLLSSTTRLPSLPLVPGCMCAF